MNILIDSTLLGSQKHLIVLPDGFKWVEKIPDSTWHFSGKLKNDSGFCWDTVLKLAFINHIPQVPERFIKSMSLVMSETPPWSMIIPQEKYREFFNEVVNYVKNNFDTSTEYYEKAWKIENKCLNSLRPAKVDGARITEIINSGAFNSHIAESFRPRGGGYASPVVYNRFSTVTGRLTVESGPNVLLLKKEYRDIIKPSTQGGKIVSLDFSSLEARILLYESGNDCPDQDLYSTLAHKLGGLPRDVVKGVVLSVLYGSSKSMVAMNLGISETRVSEIMSKIESYIDTKSLVKRLRSQFAGDGHIRNRFGRKIKIDRPQDNIFINYYAQSTGVDVSLIGFSKIIENLGTDGVRPLFVLHDALIIDVHPDRIEDVAKTKEINIPGYTQMFPLKFEEISK